jgi:hypothetical protein
MRRKQKKQRQWVEVIATPLDFAEEEDECVCIDGFLRLGSR